MKKHFLPILALTLLGTLCHPDVRAAGVVNSPDQASLLSALEGGGTVTVECDGTIYLTNTITVATNTVLDGNGHSISISGGGSNRVFFVQTNVQFTLQGLSVVDGFSTNGGGLYNDGGNVVITNCAFLRNSAAGNPGIADLYWPTAGSTAAGGALFNSGEVIVADCIFEENNARGGTGGAILSAGAGGFAGAGGGGEATGAGVFNIGTAFIAGTTFGTNMTHGGSGGYSGNSSISGGGGGLAAGAAVFNSRQITISNCVFIANLARGGSGGGATVYGGGGGQGAGGATYNRGGSMQHLNSSLNANRSLGGPGGGSGSKAGVGGRAFGGAHYNTQNGSSHLTQCSFVENGAGGYVSFGGACYNATGVVEMVLCNVISNSVSGSSHFFSTEGGGIYNGDRLSLLDSSLESNTAYGAPGIVSFRLYPDASEGGNANGGALLNAGHTVITNSTFADNAAIGGPGASYQGIFGEKGQATGGGIANRGNLVLVNSDVSDNHVEGFAAGGAGIFSSSNATLVSSTAISNTTSLQTRLRFSLLPVIAVIGADALFFVTGENSPEIGYEWFSFETNLITGEVGRSYRLVNLQTNDLGVYRVQFEDNIGKVNRINLSISPDVVTPPENKTAAAGQPVTFSVAATGFPVSFQWFFNSVPIPNANGATYAFTAGAMSAGTYSVLVSNIAGTASASATLYMPPTFTAVLPNQIVPSGESARFHAAVGGTAPLYFQWHFNGQAIPGATDSSYVISSARGIHEGSYSVTVTNDFGSVTDASGSLTVSSLVHWQKSDGALASWQFSRTNFVQSTLLSPATGPSPAWRMIGLSDFNEDGHVDQLWQRTNGTLAVWFMNQTTRIESILLRDGQSMSSVWRFVGFGDFNGDTQTDFLWQHSDRRLAAWFMGGTNFLGSGLLRNGQPAGVGWRAMGAHDFDHDSHSDVLLQHDDGRIAIWKMNETSLVNALVLRNGKPAGVGWRVTGLSDFNDDGEKDILIRNKDGRLAVWFMNETEFVSAILLRNGPASFWRSVGVR